MDKPNLEKLKEAKAVICAYCLRDACEWCAVDAIIQEAQDEYETDKLVYDYDENNSYSPSCPWNAPGMSIKDFI